TDPARDALKGAGTDDREDRVDVPQHLRVVVEDVHTSTKVDDELTELDLVLDIAGVVDRLVRGDVQVRAGVVAVDVLIVHLVEAEVVVPVAPDRDTAKGLERKLVVAGDPAFGEALNKVLRAVLVGIETCERGTGDV